MTQNSAIAKGTKFNVTSYARLLIKMHRSGNKFTEICTTVHEFNLVVTGAAR